MSKEPTQASEDAEKQDNSASDTAAELLEGVLTVFDLAAGLLD